MREQKWTDGSPSAGGAVLCAVDDPDLRAQLLGLCQELGVQVTPEGSPRAGGWTTAPVVLLDAGAAARLGHLPRRDDVVVVCDDTAGAEPGPDVWRAAVAAGAGRVVVLPAGRAWLADAVATACRPRGLCVAVVGARGGAGATTTAVALTAAGLSAGQRVLLVDADPLGGGLDLAVGAEELPGPRWADLHDLRPPLPPGGLAASLPSVDGAALLSYGRAGPAVRAEAMSAVLRAGAAEHDLVVVDLPRCGDEPARAAAGLADVVLCVCPCEVRAVAAAPAVLRGWACPAPVHLLLRGPAPGGLRADEAAAAVRAGLEAGRGRSGGVAARADPLQRVDVVRREPRVASALERGEPFAASARSPLRRWADRWVQEQLKVGRRGAA